MSLTYYNTDLINQLIYYQGKACLILLIMLSLRTSLPAQEPSPDVHVYPVGNLADIKAGSPVIEAVTAEVKKNKCPAAIVFTGDITKSNLADIFQRTQDSIRLRSIIQQLQSDLILGLVFIPGDRDWAYSGKTG